MKYFLNFVWASKLLWMVRKITEKIDGVKCMESHGDVIMDIFLKSGITSGGHQAQNSQD